MLKQLKEEEEEEEINKEKLEKEVLLCECLCVFGMLLEEETAAQKRGRTVELEEETAP